MTRVQGIRGATSTDGNTKDAILEATSELLERLVQDNNIRVDDIAAAFATVVFAARTTFTAFEYARKFAAVKKCSKLLSSGFWNISTRLSSSVIKVTSSIGPQRNLPANPPVEVPAPTTTLVRSISEVFTPGLT